MLGKKAWGLGLWQSVAKLVQILIATAARSLKQ